MSHGYYLEIPPRSLLPVISHALSLYKLWQGYKNDFPRHLLYSLGKKIDNAFLATLERLFIASYQAREEKVSTLLSAMKQNDLLKFFLQIAWELHALDNKKYALISDKADELGRMIGGWKRGVETRTPRP